MFPFTTCFTLSTKNRFKQQSEKEELKVVEVTGIRPIAPMQNRGPLEDILAPDVKFFGKERN